MDEYSRNSPLYPPPPGQSSLVSSSTDKICLTSFKRNIVPTVTVNSMVYENRVLGVITPTFQGKIILL